jgi:hypothetical protein
VEGVGVLNQFSFLALSLLASVPADSAKANASADVKAFFDSLGGQFGADPSHIYCSFPDQVLKVKSKTGEEKESNLKDLKMNLPDAQEGLWINDPSVGPQGFMITKSGEVLRYDPETDRIDKKSIQEVFPSLSSLATFNREGQALELTDLSGQQISVRLNDLFQDAEGVAAQASATETSGSETRWNPSYALTNTDQPHFGVGQEGQLYAALPRHFLKIDESSSQRERVYLSREQDSLVLVPTNDESSDGGLAIDYAVSRLPDRDQIPSSLRSALVRQLEAAFRFEVGAEPSSGSRSESQSVALSKHDSVLAQANSLVFSVAQEIEGLPSIQLAFAEIEALTASAVSKAAATSVATTTDSASALNNMNQRIRSGDADQKDAKEGPIQESKEQEIMAELQAQLMKKNSNEKNSSESGQTPSLDLNVKTEEDPPASEHAPLPAPTPLNALGYAVRLDSETRKIPIRILLA